jgi:hypothetical protein
MIWENFTFSAEIRMMAQRNPEELIGYIAKNLRSIAKVTSAVAGYCGTEGIGTKPPGTLAGGLDDALKIAGGEVILSQLTEHLAIACAEALDRGIRPTAALKEPDYPGFEDVNGAFYKALDEFGMIYTALNRQRGSLRRAIGRNQFLEKSGISGENPLRIVWKNDGTTTDTAVGFVIATEAYEAARDSLITAISTHSSLIRG